MMQGAKDTTECKNRYGLMNLQLKEDTNVDKVTTQTKGQIQNVQVAMSFERE
jgi:hypothetical protein